MPCTTGMRVCRKGCLHRAMVTDYHVAREASLIQQEEQTRGYTTEALDCPALTFKDWLIGLAGSAQSQEAHMLGRDDAVAAAGDECAQAFRRILAEVAPGRRITVNHLRHLLDAADIPNQARGGLFAQACEAGLLRPVRVQLDIGDWADVYVRSTGESANGARVRLYERPAA